MAFYRVVLRASYNKLIAGKRDRLAVVEVLYLLDSEGHRAHASLCVPPRRIVVSSYHAPLHHHVVGAIRHVGHSKVVTVRGKSGQQDIEAASRGGRHAYACGSADVTARAVSVRRTLDRCRNGNTSGQVPEECVAYLLDSLVIDDAV